MRLLLFALPLAFLFSCSTARVKPEPFARRAPSAFLESMPSTRMLTSANAGKCLQEICGPRYELQSLEGLRERNSDIKEYLKTEFAYRMDGLFNRLHEAELVNDRRKAQIIETVLNRADRGASDLSSFHRAFALTQFMKVYYQVALAYYRQFKYDTKARSDRDYFNLDEEFISTSKIADVDKRLLLEVFRTPLWTVIAEHSYQLERANFDRGHSRDSVRDVSDHLNRLRTECKSNIEAIATNLGISSEPLWSTFSACQQVDDKFRYSRERRDRLWSQSHRSHVLRALSDERLKNILGSYSPSRATLESRKPGIERKRQACHLFVGTEWNLSAWPERSAERIREELPRVIEAAAHALNLSPEMKSQFVNYLRSYRLVFPESREQFEERARVALEAQIGEIDMDEAKYSRAGLVERAWYTGLFRASPPLNEFCYGLRENLLPDSIFEKELVINVGLFSLHVLDHGRMILAHELGHGISSFFKDKIRAQSRPGLGYRGAGFQVAEWETRACIDRFHYSPAEEENAYTEEDFADRMGAKISSRMGWDGSFFCGLNDRFAKLRPRRAPLDPEIRNSSFLRHSIDVFRSVHFHKVRHGSVPKSCEAYLQEIQIPACF